MGRCSTISKPEDLPIHQPHLLLSGERLKCKSPRTFIFLSLLIFRKQSLKNSSTMNKRFFIVAAVLLSSRALSQQADSAVTNGEEFPTTHLELSRVVVTATKFPRKQVQTGKVMTVITRAQLEKSGGSMLGEVLNTVAGTNIVGANNNLGTNQTVSIRGASAGNVLLLIDGIPVNDPSVI